MFLLIRRGQVFLLALFFGLCVVTLLGFFGDSSCGQFAARPHAYHRVCEFSTVMVAKTVATSESYPINSGLSRAVQQAVRGNLILSVVRWIFIAFSQQPDPL